jgi:hypothetical protein
MRLGQAGTISRHLKLGDGWARPTWAPLPPLVPYRQRFLLLRVFSQESTAPFGGGNVPSASAPSTPTIPRQTDLGVSLELGRMWTVKQPHVKSLQR